MDSQTQKNLLNIVKRNYDEIAEEFSQSRDKFYPNLWSGLVEIAKNIKAGDKIMDVGCGNGRLVDVFGNKKIYSGKSVKNSHAGVKYLGIDNSEKILKIAKRKYKGENIDFKLGNLLELGKIPEINFNYVFCIAVLHHIPRKKLRIQALRQLKNKVSQNGKIIITNWNLWSNNHKKDFKKLILKFSLLKLIKKNKMDFGDVLFDGFSNKSKRYYHAFTKFGLRRLAKKAGLKIEKIYKDKYNYYMILRKKS